MASGVLTYDNFRCSMCGTCCRKQKVVLLTLDDIFRLSERLGLRPTDFFKKYCTMSAKFNSEGRKRFYIKADGGCPFLKDNLCSVQDVKPLVCARNPFYYFEASLAALKVFGIIEDECRINAYPYDTMTKGDNERLMDLDMLVKATDEYIARYGRFDEKTAARFDEKAQEDRRDPRLRDFTYATLVDQSVRREEQCRTDPYFRGATNMYIGGFYRDFKRVVKGPDVAYSFEPSALGMIDSIMALVLFEKDYKVVKRLLAGHDGADVHTRTSPFEGREYVLVSIAQKGGKKLVFYYHIDPAEKKELQHAPGEVTIDFKGEKGGSFIFKGRDADGWLPRDTA